MNGTTLELLLQLRIKQAVDHAGHSQQSVPSKPTGIS
jgi:hypothetical protein